MASCLYLHNSYITKFDFVNYAFAKLVVAWWCVILFLAPKGILKVETVKNVMTIHDYNKGIRFISIPQLQWISLLAGLLKCILEMVFMKHCAPNQLIVHKDGSLS